jgi:hypothetical protein
VLKVLIFGPPDKLFGIIPNKNRLGSGDTHVGAAVVPALDDRFTLAAEGVNNRRSDAGPSAGARLFFGNPGPLSETERDQPSSSARNAMRITNSPGPPREPPSGDPPAYLYALVTSS